MKANLRHVHARLIAHAEEVAFYGGHKVSGIVMVNNQFDYVRRVMSRKQLLKRCYVKKCFLYAN